MSSLIFTEYKNNPPKNIWGKWKVQNSFMIMRVIKNAYENLKKAFVNKLFHGKHKFEFTLQVYKISLNKDVVFQ